VARPCSNRRSTSDGDDGDGLYWALLGARAIGAELVTLPAGAHTCGCAPGTAGQ